ncbi:uncharacterized protein LOC126971237 isoform X2 [Leptidea sinapis]|uniref:uncharacterized protein LOC126971237 isoform X2 n=1 Tax=Leptidea sinapis TaxID=189913 RepID=UPI0021C4889A|nr:uncharacterized protein LOC126971237 isoform X2 [Leptidea sinapis]
MYILFTIGFIISGVNCASYQRYGETTRYPSYTTIANLYNQNQFPYKSNYGSDIASFPEVTRYPNYNLGRSTGSPNVYTSPGSGNAFFQPGYTTPRYDAGYDGNYQSNGYMDQNYGPVSPYERPFMQFNNDYCVNRTPQNGIWIESLTGMWYGVEFIQHLAGDSRVDYARSCIVIHISEPNDRPSTENQLYHVQAISAKFRQEYRHLRLLWDEAGQTIEYALYFRNDSAGYWQAFDVQNGTLTVRPSYKQFTGTVQVLKAVNDHLVLNFCQEATVSSPAQLYSVLFSREPGQMARWEIDSVHSMLQNKKLSVASRRMVCGNNAARNVVSVLSLLSIILSYISLN